jgi:citrate lyase beta subunit
MKTTLTPDLIAGAVARLHDATTAFAARYPGDSGARQPVHSFYGGAHIFKADSIPRLGKAALRTLEEYAGEDVEFARILGLPGAERVPDLPDRFSGVRARLHAEASRRGDSPAMLVHTVYSRVLEKLKREPVEDFRIDFEDGYGNRLDAEEDRHAAEAASEMAAAHASGLLPPFTGIRIKPFTEDLRARSIRTLDIFLTRVRDASSASGASSKRSPTAWLPSNFVVTLPKVVIPDQVAALADLFDVLEPLLGLPPKTLRLEIMVEATQAIFNERGEVNVPRLVHAARGRCVAAHFGTYDYTASCNITAAHQHMTHLACDFAKHVMQVSLAGTGVWLSDGATNIMPIPPHRAVEGGTLSDDQVRENRDAVHRAWKLHYDDVQHSLANAYYQGWDLHPAQLPTRYAAVYAFFLAGLPSAAERLRAFVQRAAQGTLVGDVFDDAATGQGLLNYFLRAVNCGAVTEQETLDETGLTLEELRGRSFLKILKNRRTG